MTPLKAKTCPICGKPATEKMQPFCSARCQSVDLNRWLSEGYAIPAIEPPEDLDEQLPPGKDEET